MFKQIFFLFLLQKISSFYTEIEGVSEFEIDDDDVISKLEPKRFYWSEIEGYINVLYFDNSLKLYTRPFLVFITLPDVTPEDWLNKNRCQLLTNALDNFHKNSTFWSFLPNKENRNFYEFPQDFLGLEDIIAAIKLEQAVYTVIARFKLEKITDCVSLLKTVEFGTNFWGRLYKTQEVFHWLFVEIFYVQYQNTNENSYDKILFRSADLIEIIITSFEVKSLKEQNFVSELNHPFKVESKQNVWFNKQKNTYPMKDLFDFTIFFDLEKNENKQFKFVLNKTELDEYDEIPTLVKLNKVGKRVYHLKLSYDENLTIETPIYFFGEKVVLSKLVVKLKYIFENENGSAVSSVFNLFEFDEKEISDELSFGKSLFFSQLFHVSYSHIIENGKIVIKVNTIKDYYHKNLVFEEKETLETYEPSQTDIASAFVDGLIIHNEDTLKVLIDPDYSTEIENASRTSDEKTINELVYILIFLVLLIGFVSIICLFYLKRKKHTRKTI